MARERMVTRSIKGTKAQVMVVNIESGETSTQDVTLSTTYKTGEKLFKAIEKVVSVNPSMKAVHVISSTEIESLYGMPEQDFMEHAVRLDPITRKAVPTNTEEV